MSKYRLQSVFFFPYMNDSLPALSRFAYSMVSAPKELKDFIRKHGHKFLELKLQYYDASNILDLCPALNVLTFCLTTRVGPVCPFLLASVYVFDSMASLLSSIAVKSTHR
jgi:hypothetical protein